PAADFRRDSACGRADYGRRADVAESARRERRRRGRRRGGGCRDRQRRRRCARRRDPASSPDAGANSRASREDAGIKLYDLTHPFSVHTPGWVGYPSPKLSYFQRFATQGIVSQLLELPLHSGTHYDSEMHIVSGGKDIGSIPIERLCRKGVIVDISDELEDCAVIR